MLACTACEKFLEENPTDRITGEEAYSTEGELYRNAVANLYSMVGGNSNSQGLQGTGPQYSDASRISAPLLSQYK